MEQAAAKDPKQMDLARKVIGKKARDHARTPVQWSAAENAGFCPPGVKPWMRVNDDYKTVNAEAQRKQESKDLSVLQFWQRGLENRKQHKDVFVYGDFHLLDEDHPCIFAYKRNSDKEAFVVVLNFSGKHVEWKIPGNAKVKSWVAGTYGPGQPELATTRTLKLRPWEGALGKQTPSVDGTDMLTNMDSYCGCLSLARSCMS